MVSKVTSGTTTSTGQLQIERSRMRVESNDAAGARQTIIFDGAKKVLYIIDNAKKTYNEMTQADVDKIAGMANDAMAQMNKAMENMTPEQRAQMAAMMGRMGGRGMAMPSAAPAKVVYKKTGTDKVGKWTCDKYEATKDGEKSSEVCTVDPAVIGFTGADFAVTRQMADFFSKMVPKQAEQMFSIGRIEEQGFNGFPVRQTLYNAGQTTTTEITEISKQTFPDSVFAVPAGFQKVDMMGMGGRGRGGK
jgi:hypothetical protein